MFDKFKTSFLDKVEKTGKGPFESIRACPFNHVPERDVKELLDITVKHSAWDDIYHELKALGPKALSKINKQQGWFLYESMKQFKLDFEEVFYDLDEPRRKALEGAVRKYTQHGNNNQFQQNMHQLLYFMQAVSAAKQDDEYQASIRQSHKDGYVKPPEVKTKPIKGDVNF